MEQVNSEQLLPRIYSVEESLRIEQQKRIENSKTHSQIGVSYFDHALGGVYANDVLLIGAKSGVGKTELATSIALANAKSGRRVMYFALEAEDQEITRRIKFKYVSKFFYQNLASYRNINLRYQDWYYNKYGSSIEACERYANDELLKIGGNLKTIYRTASSYTAEDFRSHFFALQDEADMFIVDHVHYFDSEEPNENKALKDTMKRIRDCAQLGGKPIVLVAHVRKSDTRNKSIIPDLEDFHGSSDLGKIATKAIAIAPAYDQERNGTLYPTYMKVLKSRVGSDTERFTALSWFDVSSNSYSQEYVIGTHRGDKFTELEEDALKPQWANRMAIKNEFGEVRGYV